MSKALDFCVKYKIYLLIVISPNACSKLLAFGSSDPRGGLRGAGRVSWRSGIIGLRVGKTAVAEIIRKNLPAVRPKKSSVGEGAGKKPNPRPTN